MSTFGNTGPSSTLLDSVHYRIPEPDHSVHAYITIKGAASEQTGAQTVKEGLTVEPLVIVEMVIMCQPPSKGARTVLRSLLEPTTPSAHRGKNVTGCIDDVQTQSRLLVTSVPAVLCERRCRCFSSTSLWKRVP